MGHSATRSEATGEGEQIQQATLELALNHLSEAAGPRWQGSGSVRALQAGVLGLQLGEGCCAGSPSSKAAAREVAGGGAAAAGGHAWRY